MHGNELRVAGGDGLAVANRRPLDWPCGVALAPGKLQKARHTEAPLQRWCARRVIDVRMRDQHLTQRGPCKRLVDAIEVRSLTGPCVDQRRHPAGNEPCPVAVTRDRPGIEGEDRYRVQKNTFSRAYAKSRRVSRPMMSSEVPVMNPPEPSIHTLSRTLIAAIALVNVVASAGSYTAKTLTVRVSRANDRSAATTRDTSVRSISSSPPLLDHSALAAIR